MKKLVYGFFSILLVLVLIGTTSVKADVLWEPSDNFFDENNCVYTVEQRVYMINSPNGFVNVYSSPDSAFTTGQIKNGDTFFVYYKGTYKDKLWGLNTSEEYIPLDHAVVVYDHISFSEEYKDKINIVKDECFELKKGYLRWRYPGAETFEEMPIDVENAYASYRFTDEQGLNWLFFGYVNGIRNFWICIDDPENDKLPVREVNRPEMYEVLEPTQEQIREAAKEDIGSNTLGSRKGITIVVACICTLTVIFIAAYFITRKSAIENN
ncbi:MAG: hypothetical protein K6F63_07670 [Lachnospiraceae bacterium]|nr:hypothetical protein [Lachnospiraceae bacterium]